MSLTERFNALASQFAELEVADTKPMLEIHGKLRELKSELSEGLPESLASTLDSAIDSITSLVWQETDDSEATLRFVNDSIKYAHQVLQAIDAGDAPESIQIPVLGNLKAQVAEAAANQAPSIAPNSQNDDNAVDAELLTLFVDACQATLERLEHHVLEIGGQEDPKESLDEILRGIHTIKGECGVLSLEEAQRVCHRAEELIGECSSAAVAFPTEPILSLIDWLGNYVRLLSSDFTAQAPSSDELMVKLMESPVKGGQTDDAEHHSKAAQQGNLSAPIEPSQEALGEIKQVDLEVAKPQADAASEPAVTTDAAAAEPTQVEEKAEPTAVTSYVVDPESDELVSFPAAVFEDPLLGEVLEEMRQHLEDAEAALLEWSDNLENTSLVDVIFRAFHTLKGVGGFMQLETIVRVAHKSETLLDEFRKGSLACSPEHLALLFRSRDMMDSLLDTLGGEEAPRVCIVNELLNDLGYALDGSGAQSAPVVEQPTANIEEEARTEADGVVIPQPEVPQKAQVAVEAEAAAKAQVEQASATSSESTQATGTGAPAKKKPAAKKKLRIEKTVKVGTSRLDSLVDMVGELVIAQQMVSQDPELTGISGDRLTRNLSQVAKITRDLQEAAMHLRMVPLSPTFQKMKRLVHDVARKSGKNVDLHILGEETELDRNVVEEIGDPLVHLVRNAVDHGLEGPEERIAAGKAAEGKLELRAHHQGGSIVIEMRDDGRGLNREKIFEKSKERGLIPAEAQIDDMPDSELWMMIFQPGFSTAAQVTDISGRGVGLDVVRRKIESLRGKIEIESKFGEGTCFILRLPLTLAIIDGMTVRIGERRYVIPTLTIEQSFRPSQDQLSGVLGQGEVVDVRGKMIPVHSLKEMLSLGEGVDDVKDGILLVVETSNGRVCLLVDEILGQHQIVIKSIGKALPPITGISGGAILGDGTVALIIDADSLVANVLGCAV